MNSFYNLLDYAQGDAAGTQTQWVLYERAPFFGLRRCGFWLRPVIVRGRVQLMLQNNFELFI